MDLETIWGYIKKGYAYLVEEAEKYAEKCDREERMRAVRMSDDELNETNTMLQNYDGDSYHLKVRREKVADEIKRRGL